LGGDPLAVGRVVDRAAQVVFSENFAGLGGPVAVWKECNRVFHRLPSTREWTRFVRLSRAARRSVAAGRDTVEIAVPSKVSARSPSRASTPRDDSVPAWPDASAPGRSR